MNITTRKLFRLTPLAVAAALAMPLTAQALVNVTDPEDSGGYVRPKLTPTQYQAMMLAKGGHYYTTASAVVKNPTSPFTGMQGILTGGGTDYGNFRCDNCVILPGPNGTDSVGITSFITSVVNPILWPANGVAWRPGDTVAICNGTYCIVMLFRVTASNPWIPKPNTPIKLDPGKGYKNPEGGNTPTRFNPNNTTQFFDWGNYRLFDFVENGYVGCVCTVGPLVPVNATGGGYGGWSCVHVDSVLPDGRLAGYIKVGDSIQLGDENSLESGLGVVTYSETKMAQGYLIRTQSGIALRCSDTAPIAVEGGQFKTPPQLKASASPFVSMILSAAW